jgi:hypothetical protein
MTSKSSFNLKLDLKLHLTVSYKCFTSFERLRSGHFPFCISILIPYFLFSLLSLVLISLSLLSQWRSTADRRPSQIGRGMNQSISNRFYHSKTLPFQNALHSDARMRELVLLTYVMSKFRTAGSLISYFFIMTILIVSILLYLQQAVGYLLIDFFSSACEKQFFSLEIQSI